MLASNRPHLFAEFSKGFSSVLLGQKLSVNTAVHSIKMYSVMYSKFSLFQKWNRMIKLEDRGRERREKDLRICAN